MNLAHSAGTPAVGWGSASGKVILFGEHAVVYGVPAIVCGVDLGAHARAVASGPAERPSLGIESGGVVAQPGGPPLDALCALLSALQAPAMRVEVRSALPAGCGLGASAAQGAAVARAVLSVMGREDRDGRWALAGATAWESVFHGNPSGVDTVAALRGGCLHYQRGRAIEPLELPRPVPLVVAVAAPPASTKAMVEAVARLRAAQRPLVDDVFGRIAEIVEEGERRLRVGDLRALGPLLDANHEQLARLELSTPAIEEARRVARAAGALGVKLTGSGGGGAVIALVDGDPGPVLAAFAAAGVRAFPAAVGAAATPGRRDPQAGASGVETVV